MSLTLFFAYAGSVLFLLCTGALAYIIFHIFRGTLPFASRLALPSRALRSSEQIWQAGHRAACPLLCANAFFTGIHAVACAAFAWCAPAHPLTVFLPFNGILVASVLWVLADKVAVWTSNHV
ncbi:MULTISPECIES: hypothetical protein [unclassified Schaalia]|uniref:hypothetical protein n=1 Tax=unclassified Schaalia TaxID=2691889 RepID=UPI001E42AAB6|nr:MULTISPECIES: hypothetical protein [unclassified Schaalia]MCD4549792.1 hypothetical protein [Schaalia sp. lx-260]MCD4556808.1 hypothetical protein [Schaalia sp. lx-100]